ncbi:MAG: tetratricopeptide repeat protein, partial [Magnetococcales bacterium]|nr:tetratricopeptide repeat protein [Magnetococcales bacterium]
MILTIDEALCRAIDHHQGGRWSEAESLYRAILQHHPRHPEANHNLGVLILQHGEPAASLPHFQLSLEGHPRQEQFWLSLLAALVLSGHCDAAARLLTRGRPSGWQEAAVRPDRKETGHPPSVPRPERLVTPDFATACFNCGNRMRIQDRLDCAVTCYQAAISCNGRHFAACHNLGATYFLQTKWHQAVACFQRAIGIQPDSASAHNNLGIVYHELGRLPEAEARFRRALEIQPDFAEARWRLALMTISLFRDTPQERRQSRIRLHRELRAVHHWFAARHWPCGEGVVGSAQPFELAYYNHNNRALLTRYGTLCTQLMQAWRQAANLPESPVPVETGGPVGLRPPIRVGIVSRYFHDHSVWHAIVKGWCVQMDRERFRLFAFDLSTRPDQETRTAQSLCEYVSGPRSLQDWVLTILAARPDVLLYPEVGMDTITVQLASLRLAPTQLASWGHPETTGLATIDYFLSAELFEGEHAARFYREKLIQLPHCGSYFDRMTREDGPGIDPADFGLRPDRPILICAGSPFKYPPVHDDVLLALLHNITDCQLVFFNLTGRGESLCQRRNTRLHQLLRSSGLPDSRIHFLPWLSKEQFPGLLRAATMMLDTIDFSGFNTVLQAIECALPVVTLEGRFLRGRLGAGLLRRLGMGDIVARDKGGYIELATRIARDDAFRNALRGRMMEALPVLFQDTHAMDRLQEFLERIVSDNPPSGPTPPTTRSHGPDGHDARSNRASAPLTTDQALRQAVDHHQAHALVTLFNDGRLAELENRARALTERDPGDGPAWKMLGLALLQRGDGAGALTALQQAVRLLPDDAETHGFQGLACHEQGQMETATRCFHRALAIHPDSADTHNNLGLALLALGRSAEAETSFLHALTLRPNQAEILYNLGLARLELNRFAEAD